MNQSPEKSPDGVKITVSPDRMAVLLSIQQGSKASSAEIIGELRALKIARFDDGIVIEALEKSKTANESIGVAKGVPAVDDRPGRAEYLVPVAKGSAAATKVEAGQVIASIVPVVCGTDGTDVFGQPVERKKCPPPVQTGRNLTEGKGKVVCQAGGNLRLIGNVLSVEPLLEIRGSDGITAPVSFDGDAVIRGTLGEGRTIQVTGSLVVSGTVEAAHLTTGGSVVVQGGIVGKQKGRYMIGGDLKCRYISGGFIISGKDVLVQSGITESRIACGGRLTVEQGAIFGGALAANSGLTCATLGNTNGAPTLIETGEGIANRSFIAAASLKIESNQKRIEMIRAKIAPLLKVMKELTPPQRERATELLYEADELELATKKRVADLEIQSRSLSESACAEVVVTQMIHPGVTVRFPEVKTVFSSPIKGPLTLTQRKMDGLVQMLLTDDTSQTTIILPTTPTKAENPAHRAANAA